jgi:integrase
MPAKYYVSDGAGLYLVLSPIIDGDRAEKRVKGSHFRDKLTDKRIRSLARGRSSSRWVYRYMIDGRRREMSLGSYPEVTLAQARDKATTARRLKVNRLDPLEHRVSMRLAERLEAARSRTFRECAETYIEEQSPNWRNEKHAKQWRSTLETYAYPTIAEVSISDIDAPLIRDILKPIWTEKPETARRVKGRIAAILDWAANLDYRDGDNPARRPLFPTVKKAEARRVQHHAALPYEDLPAFLEELKAQEGAAALALQFTILTAARTGDSIGVTWDEIDFDKSLWTIPAERMKAERDHRVPLSKQALSILKGQPTAANASEYLLPGARQNKPLSNMAMLETLRRMGRSDITVHGFRSTFKDWASEQTAFPNEVSEAALAHAVGDKVEAAYRRGELLEKRRKLMNAWGAYCASKPVEKKNIIPLRKRAV